MKTKIISVMLISLFLIGLFFYGSNANGFNAHFYGSRPSYTYQPMQKMISYNTYGYNHVSSNLFSGSSSSLNYRFGFWAL